jgi:hypothetical protein
MNMSLNDIIKSRVKHKCYLIYDAEGDLFLVYGTSYRVIKSGSLYDIILSFIFKSTSWKYTERHIKMNKNLDYRSWTYLNSQSKDIVIDVDTLYIDGIKQEIKKID